MTPHRLVEVERTDRTGDGRSITRPVRVHHDTWADEPAAKAAAMRLNERRRQPGRWWVPVPEGPVA